MKNQITIFALFLVLILISQGHSGEWVGPNLVTNGGFGSNLSGWEQWPNYWSCSQGRAILRDSHKDFGGSGTLYQMITAQSGKRYRVTGEMQTSHISHEAQIGFDSWWGFPEINTGWQSYTQPQTKSIIGIAPADSIYVSLKARGVPAVEAFFDNISFNQIVYDPQVSISTNEIRINSSTPNGAQANVNLSFDSLCDYADALTSWSMNWGDGHIDSNPTLGISHTHSYSIANNNERSQSWQGVFSGNNQAGTDSKTANITVLRQPVANLMVDGLLVADGDTIEINIFEDSNLDLSLFNSLGYTEGASFTIDGLLDQGGIGIWNFSYSGSLFDESDIGKIYSLNAGVYNTGLGDSADYMNVHLNIVPEPASVLLLGFGVFLIRRK